MTVDMSQSFGNQNVISRDKKGRPLNLQTSRYHNSIGAKVPISKYWYHIQSVFIFLGTSQHTSSIALILDHLGTLSWQLTGGLQTQHNCLGEQSHLRDN